jgi:hypothetical protein
MFTSFGGTQRRGKLRLMLIGGSRLIWATSRSHRITLFLLSQPQRLPGCSERELEQAQGLALGILGAHERHLIAGRDAV